MKKTVVFAALNWGLGHATRLVPLIHQYEQNNWNVLLVSDGVALSFLKKEFPHLEALDTQNPELTYASGNHLLGHLKQLLSPFLKSIKRDLQFVEQLVKDRDIDLIISDNRYGFRHSTVESIIISHQLQLALPKQFHWGKKIVQAKLNHWLNAFSSCWIVDTEQHDLAGELSQAQHLKIPCKYIGLQSRLYKEELEQDIDYLVVISGLEPHRTYFEQQALACFENSDKKVVIVGGKPDRKQLNTTIEYISFADTKTLNHLVNRAKIVISRAGYSSLMDWQKLQKKAIVIPTPGQTEQEYLAEHYQNHPNIKPVINLDKIL